SGFADDRERVVLLEKQLTRRVEPDRARRGFVPNLAGAVDDQVHRLIPRRRLELAVFFYQRPRQAVRAVIGLESVEALGAEPAAVDGILGAAAHTNDAAF